MSFGLGFSKQKSKSSSESSAYGGNYAYDDLSSLYKDQPRLSVDAGEALKNFLFGSGQNQAFDTYRKNTGYDYLFGEGMRGVNAGMAANGLYNSGARYKALQDRGMQMANASIGDYLQQLFGLSDLGYKGASILTDAGRYNTADSKSTGTSSGFSVSFNGKGS